MVLAFELGADRGLQFRDAVDVGVFGLALIERLLSRVLDVLRGIEIGFPRRQRNDIAACRFELARLCRDRDRGGGLNAVQAVGDKAHVGVPNI